MGLRAYHYLLISVLACLMLAVSPVSAAFKVELSQSGAESGEVMKGVTFTVQASGWTGTCSQALISFGSCSSCSLSGEKMQKTVGQGQTVSWTTVAASQKATGQTISVTMSGGGACSGSGSSSPFDIVLPPSLTLDASTSESSADKDVPFDINIEITNNGETTASDLVIDATTTGFSTDCSSVSTLEEGQSAAQSCTVTASGIAGGSKTVTLEVSSTNADSATDTISIYLNPKSGDGICDPGESGTSDCETGDGDGGPTGGPTGGAVTPPKARAQNRTRVQELNPGVGLINNTRLQAAIEKVLAKGKLSEQAKDNLLRLSESINADVSASKRFEYDGAKSRISSSFKYKGKKKVKNFILFESVPKDFAESASDVTVTAPGAKVEVAEDDPSWVILYPDISPGQEISITYEVAGMKNESVLDEVGTEVYAESLETAGPEAEGEEPEPGPGTGEEEEEPPLFALDMSTILLIAIGIVAVFIVILVVLFIKSRKGGVPATAVQAVKQDLGQ